MQLSGGISDSWFAAGTHTVFDLSTGNRCGVRIEITEIPQSECSRTGRVDKPVPIPGTGSSLRRIRIDNTAAFVSGGICAVLLA